MNRIVPNLLVRRLVMAAVALALGYGITFLVVRLVLQTTVAEYAWGPEKPIPIPYFFFTGLMFALGIAVWLDKFMDTQIMRH